VDDRRFDYGHFMDLFVGEWTGEPAVAELVDQSQFFEGAVRPESAVPFLSSVSSQLTAK
jgi:hypothetical protein